MHQTPIRTDLFGLANHLGLAATAILAVLLASSIGQALGALGLGRWSRLARE